MEFSFPHCDPKILHSPEANCAICNEYADSLQYIRKIWGINFTGEHSKFDADGNRLLPCPAEVARPLENINKWGGNTIKKPGWEEELQNSLTAIFGELDENNNI